MDKYKKQDLEHQAFDSMDWLIGDYQDMLKKRKKDEPFTLKLQIIDIFEDRYDPLLVKYIDLFYPKLKLIYQMKKGQFKSIVETCDTLVPKASNESVKDVINSIKSVNEIHNQA